MKKCSVPGCEKKHCAKGLCHSHWKQQYRGGEPKTFITKETALERFERCHIKHDSGCWLWVGGNNGTKYKYGQFHYEGFTHLAHRWAYEHFVGPIPDGEQIDHLCRNTRCVNPEHLEPVSSYENMKRMRFAKVLRARIEALEDFVRELGHDPNQV